MDAVLQERQVQPHDFGSQALQHDAVLDLHPGQEASAVEQRAAAVDLVAAPVATGAPAADVPEQSAASFFVVPAAVVPLAAV
jgi:hypothetical protein